MSSNSKYTMSDIPDYKEPEGFMLVITGQVTKKVAQNIGKNRFNKASNRYLKLGIHDSDFEIVSLYDLRNMTEVDRSQQLISQKVIVFLVENEASFDCLRIFQEEIAYTSALTFVILPSTIDEINSFKTKSENALRDKASTLSSIPTFAIPFTTSQVKSDFVNNMSIESYNFYYSFIDSVVTTVCSVYRQDDSMIGYDFNDWKHIFSGNRLLNILPTIYATEDNKANFKSNYLEGLKKAEINLTDIKNIICVISASRPPSLEQICEVTEAIENDFAIFCTTTMKLTQDLAAFKDPSIVSVNIVVSRHCEDG
ncbi:hypothetical protein [Psychrobacter sp. P11G3]|uniref:hypothetical protein n=1 Tax=Psychrobacter sp. P11G3 TaxID=1699623 RepID=UPI0007090961|nr:hypothetical protein [Psychrobacter sp. P11G3]KRG32889.1 hypothetical protein AK824_10460 [Psychrobacter sp. P11G3]